jgi:hypothetical protein
MTIGKARDDDRYSESGSHSTGEPYGYRLPKEIIEHWKAVNIRQDG